MDNRCQFYKGVCELDEQYLCYRSSNPEVCDIYKEHMESETNGIKHFVVCEEEIKPYEPPKPCEDLVVVVRCKDCESNEECTWHQMRGDPNWYCADGIRRKI